MEHSVQLPTEQGTQDNDPFSPKLGKQYTQVRLLNEQDEHPITLHN